MKLKKEDIQFITTNLGEAQKAILEKNPLRLKEISQKMISCACSYQDSGSITATVMVYTLSKLIEREDYRKIKNWDNFVKKFNSFIELAKKALLQKDQENYEKHILSARKVLTSISVNLKPYIEDVLRKSSINKGSKIYESGISLGQTSKLLGVSQWELSEYTGQKNISEENTKTMDAKQRAAMALEFFS